MTVVDLNADLGEEVANGSAHDEALLEVVTSANVACGFHAGTPAVMAAACAAAAARGVRVGAQVSYRDRAGFGRRAMDVAPEVLAEWVTEQVGVLTAVARAEGSDVSYLRPHGALYHRVVDDDVQAAAVLAGSGSLPVLGLPGSRLLALAAATGRRTVTEGFPDRGYAPAGPDGVRRLLPRGAPGALVTAPQEVARHAVALAAEVDSVCVHGDGPTAVAAARAVRAALAAAGVTVRPFL